METPIKTSTGPVARSPSSPRVAVGGRPRSSSIADILASPPPVKADVPADWTTIALSKLVSNDRLVYIDGSLPVEAAYEKMIEHSFTSLPVKGRPDREVLTEAFDYAGISTLLLLVTGHLKATTHVANLDEYVQRARAGFDVPVSFVLSLGAKEDLIALGESDPLLTAVEHFGRGVHRLIVSKSRSSTAIADVVGILSQRRVLRYFWDNARAFPSLEGLMQTPIQDLDIGSAAVISIAGDALVIDALQTMARESITSIAVVDHDANLLGNISIVDVKHLTKSTSAHLLEATCLQFLTVILTDRGLENGKDSFPVFNITPQSTLAHTIAKLVATKAHRMWIVQPPNAAKPPPSPVPASPVGGLAAPQPHAAAPPAAAAPPSPVPSPSVHSRLGGRLIGVVSLTDILNLLARTAGGDSADPHEARRQRRRSSSSSTRSSFSLEGPTTASSASSRRSVSIDRGNMRGSFDRGSSRPPAL
ncbi:uncharacterized protein V1510DRAFT_422870 [Dipodascopsis tothii]|uniref:uncharacterized protein n=1 Tax=Dipodascopsis tothii TaxID=44089 RepID=UPI0034CF694C